MSMDTERTIPLGEVTTATLAFPRGAAHLGIHAGDPDHLLTTRFSGPQPRTTVAGGTVFVRRPNRPDLITGELGLKPAQEGRWLE